ncbi:MAG: MMPL family transporter [Planctomycetes bacterium]|nr:MMPL family transporter [Planctomycetota bacterium]
MTNLQDRFFDRWGTWVARNRRRVLWGALALFVLALPGAGYTLTHLDANVLDQVSAKLVRFRYMREISEAFGGDLLAAVVHVSDEAAQDPANAAPLRAYGDLLAEELAQVGLRPEDHAALPEGYFAEPQRWLRRVECKAGAGLRQALERIGKEHLAAVLSVEDVHAVEARFDPEALAQRLKQVREELKDIDPSMDVERKRLMADPLKLAGLAQEALDRKLGGRKSNLSLHDAEGYFLSPDRTTLLVLARPIQGVNQLDFLHALMPAVQRAENRAVEAFRAKYAAAPPFTTQLMSDTYGEPAEGEPRDAQLRVGYTGLHAVTYENELSLRWDILSTTLTSGVIVILLFLLVFRELRLAWCIALTMGLAVVVTLALTALVQGKIGVMGAGFTCILLGMGVDYGIHIYSTFHHLREEARYRTEDALAETLRRCGPSVLAASLTTAVAFFGIATTHFRMLAELGLLAGIGLFVAALLMITFFPVLLAGGGDDRKAGHVAHSIRKTTIMLGRFHQRQRKGWLGVSLGVLGLLACATLILGYSDPGPEPVMGVRFDGELSNLRSLRIQAIPLRERVAAKFGQAFSDIKVLAEGPDEATAYAAAERAVANLKAREEAGEIEPLGGILDYVPAPSAQRRSLEALRAVDFTACRQRFLQAAQQEFGAAGERAFQPFLAKLDELADSARTAEVLTLAEVLQGPVGPILNLFARVDADSGRVQLLTSYLPASAPGNGGLGHTEAWYGAVAQDAERGTPEGGAIKFTSPRLVGFELKASLLRDMEWISGAVALCVATLLVITFRSAKKALLAALPLIFATLFVLAGVVVAQLLGRDFALNYVNLMIFPVLVGSAIDYGVYLVFDVYSSRRPSLEAVVAETGRGVVLCGLTTLAGFGSMVLGSYTGLIDFGWSAVLGYSGALFGALIVLPGVLNLLGAGGMERPVSLKKEQPAAPQLTGKK